MTVFAITAVVGFKSSAWIVVAALAGHGVFDALYGYVLEKSGVPVWWPAFCLAYDLGAAGSLAWLIQTSARRVVRISDSVIGFGVWLVIMSRTERLTPAHV